MQISEDDTLEMHALIKGDVQGVGFRAATRFYAIQFNLTGTVRNLPDGTVKIVAQGSKKGLENLLRKLQEEAFPSQINQLTTHFLPTQVKSSGFRIIY